MSGNVNYIKHLQAFVELMEQDNRLTPWHVSLYYALFHCWNDNQRVNPVSINRAEVMRLSKIGSVNTYTKALKQLHEWDYIVYEPSKNRWIGSQVYMYRFDNSSDNSTNNSTNKGIDNTGEHGVVTQVRPSLKSIKNNKDLKDKKVRKSKTSFASPTIDEVKNFFLEEGSTGSEAENYHDYFESNGWLVGGKAKMKNWKAAARNWIKRAQNFKGTSSTNNRLHTNNDKDYSIPL